MLQSILSSAFSQNDFTQSFLGRILDRIPNPVFVKDIEHRWVLTNTAFCEFIGHEKSELIGNTDRDFFPEEEVNVFWEQDDLVFETGEESINEEFVTDKEGNARIFSTRKNIIFDDKGNKYLVAILLDITEKKKFIEGLEESNSMLANYAHMVAHDLKSPLKTMISFSQLLNRSAKEKLDDSEKDFLEFIINAAKGMTEFVNSLLNFSKINSQKLSIEPVNMNEIVHEVVDNLAVDIAQSKCELNIGKFPKTIYADQKLIKQVFQNILCNALKFKDENRELKISIQYENKKGTHQFSISDTGIGIEKEHTSKIFEIFNKLHSSNEYEGSGMGLSICTLITESHKGKIWVESEIGKGSQFYFTIGSMKDED